jgi:uncharacterized protein (DUF952 family)
MDHQSKMDESVEFVYKIYSSEPLEKDKELSQLDSKSGYIHLSKESQIPLTANRFFSDLTTLWLRKLSLSSMKENIKWEEASNGLKYAHLYSADLPNALPQGSGIIVWTREMDQTWTEAIPNLSSAINFIH